MILYSWRGQQRLCLLTTSFQNPYLLIVLIFIADCKAYNVLSYIMSTKTSMTGIIKSTGSRVLAKANGASYILMNVEITSGPAKGLTVLATRTTVTKEAVVKSVPEMDSIVTLYHSVVPSTKAGEKNQHFFEISTGADTATNADLDTIFG